MKPNERLMQVMPVVALVLIGALYLGEWAYHSAVAPVLTAEVRR